MANIYIHDEFPPEASAMLQALYSRSALSVQAHVDKVKQQGSSKFMESYYVGYGHASIGDCGSTVLYIEGVSLLACKAIQDNPLYSGQECSTRYIDFSNQPVLDPLNTLASQQIQQNWIDFYVQAKPRLVASLKAKFPLPAGEKASVWEKAINARSFDILRGFLPAGSTSQLSWATNFRQAYDKLSLLRHHPLAELREIADRCLELLKAKYPSSFSHKTYPEQEEYLRLCAQSNNYFTCGEEHLPCEDFSYRTTIDNAELEAEELPLIRSRPQKTNLPRHLSQYGRFTCTFPLDFGSYRDLQRHRNGLCRIPLLNELLGFNDWYLEQLPNDIRNEAVALLDKQLAAIRQLAASSNAAAETMQYYYPLGTNIRCQLVYDLPEMVYVTELRSSNSVHPTLRRIAHQMHRALQIEHPQLKLHSDLSEDVFDTRRGLQDIAPKAE